MTSNGVMNIKTERKTNTYRAFNESSKTFYLDKKDIQSAMVQSWNKFCFTGGIVEFRAKLPGDPETGGLWPARKFLSSILHSEKVICILVVLTVTCAGLQFGCWEIWLVPPM
jgi:hypothetical protein